ncbi:hypothetical protein [Steroidobacter sp.]|uniref:hypothetical protein n=1 Tax=Steroidobacter sp. TaxID=1978227 RepID=UPI001A6010E8|nr:hypothetical protein [Steroidobacter sp.]MBL8266122.1 hypothetical protein [Steroidobacter sp.]
MKGSHVVTAAVLIVIALIGAWIARNTYWDEATVPLPMKGEALTNSMYAAQKLAEKLGVTAQSQRRLDQMPEPNAVIYLSYWNWDLIQSRREQLQRWVEAGGRLVADRSLIGGEVALKQWAGVERAESPEPEEHTSASDDSDIDAGCADLDTETIALVPSTKQASYYVCGLAPGSWLTTSRRASWLLSDGDEMQAVRMDIGSGSFTLINATAFESRNIFLGDNALLFIAATRLERGDHIYFLSEEKSASLLELIWKHGAAVVLLSLAVIALALWRGSLRFGPPAGVPDPARRSLAEQIVGTGRFTLRFGSGRALHAATVRALHETAHRYLSGYESMAAEARVAALAKNTGLDESSLAEAINYTGSRKAGELRKVVALLETARRSIS